MYFNSSVTIVTNDVFGMHPMFTGASIPCTYEEEDVRPSSYSGCNLADLVFPHGDSKAVEHSEVIENAYRFTPGIRLVNRKISAMPIIRPGNVNKASIHSYLGLV